jgi:hypothetical protein
MEPALAQKLVKVLEKIDRPGTFRTSGSAPVVLPGLEVEGVGQVGLPLAASQAQELKKHCEQAPYGKGEETLVDTNVRRVWQLKPERFSLTNPEWEGFLEQTMKKVQQDLGLEGQQLEAHLYDLLLYEKGSFFLPHRDGEKLDRMVATLVVVLPSSFKGGELVVRNEGQEQVIDFTGENALFRIHYAAFYADCEHEIRPLEEGYRLCLVYNLTLKKGKKGIGAPTTLEHLEPVRRILSEWARDDSARRLAVTLGHQYTQGGLTWDALKGADRVKAHVLLEAAHRAGCQAYLALLTFHESGSAEYSGRGGSGGYYGRRRRWGYDEYEDDDASNYEMGEVFESSLTANHWSDPRGKELPLGEIFVEQDELLDPEALEAIEPEEQFEGYTGNAGMTLDRWYRHAAVFIWPNRRHFDILCDAGSEAAVASLDEMVDRWSKGGEKDANLREQCVAFARAILANWKGNPYPWRFRQKEERTPLTWLLARLDEPGLIKAFLGEVMTRDASVDPGKSLLEVCRKYGWETFRPELEVLFDKTANETIERNVRLLELVCLAKPGKKEGWAELCEALARRAIGALERIDQEGRAHDYTGRPVDRAALLVGLARALLAADQGELLSQLVEHVLARPQKYPLTEVHVKALGTLKPWLEKNVKHPSPGLSRWLGACRAQLEALTAAAPQAPTDFRRTAAISCRCADCGELRRFLEDPTEQVHRFSRAQHQRSHLEGVLHQHHCDLDTRTEERGRPYTLVCTKNTASYQARLKKYQQDLEHLATVRAIEEGLPR